MVPELRENVKISPFEYSAFGNGALLSFVFIVAAIAVGVVVAVAVAKVGLLALLIIPAIVSFLGAILYPSLGIPVFVLVIYLNLSPVLVAYFNFPSIAKPFVAFLSIILLIRVFLFRDKIRGLQIPIILLGMYALIGMISLLYAGDFNTGYSVLTDSLKDMYYSFLIVAFIQQARTLRYVVWALLIAGIIMGSVSLYQQFTETFSNEYWGLAQSITSATGTGYRLGGPLGDPNYYAMILVSLVPLAIDRFWNEKSTVLRLLAGWAMAACVLTVLYTYSRGGFLALIFAVVLLGYRFRNRLRLVPVVLGISILFIVFLFLPARYTNRLSTLLSFFPQSGNNPLADLSIRGRTSEALVAFDMFLDHPVAGLGIGNYGSNYYHYARPIGIDPSIGSRQPHDLYLQIAAERGLLGLSVFAILILVTFQTLFRAEKKLIRADMGEYAGIATAVGVGLVGYLVASLFLHDSYFRYFWVLIGIVWSIPQIIPGEEVNESKYTLDRIV